VLIMVFLEAFAQFAPTTAKNPKALMALICRSWCTSRATCSHSALGRGSADPSTSVGYRQLAGV
jgi:hypothetical protein